MAEQGLLEEVVEWELLALRVLCMWTASSGYYSSMYGQLELYELSILEVALIPLQVCELISAWLRLVL